VEEGVIGLDDPINKYLGDSGRAAGRESGREVFRVVNPLGDREITFRDLLTHRSGLTSDAAGSEFAVPPPLGTFLKAEYAQDHFDSYDRSVLPRWSAKVGTKTHEFPM